jgi:AcrR family transcriptional regulator
MPRSPHTEPAPSDTGRRPRRLTRSARHQQLVDAALPVVAAQGFADVSLDAVAAAADVSRNLLYHYFPRGRPDLVLAVAEAAGHQLTDDWITDESIPLDERLAANNIRMIEHATRPSDAWRIYEWARSASDPEVRETVDRFTDAVIGAVSLNQLGTANPPPMARYALKGYLAFFGALLEETRATDAPTDHVLRVLNETLVATLRAAR